MLAILGKANKSIFGLLGIDHYSRPEKNSQPLMHRCVHYGLVTGVSIVSKLNY
jgi:hypothetical protein